MHLLSIMYIFTIFLLDPLNLHIFIFYSSNLLAEENLPSGSSLHASPKMSSRGSVRSRRSQAVPTIQLPSQNAGKFLVGDQPKAVKMAES